MNSRDLRLLIRATVRLKRMKQLEETCNEMTQEDWDRLNALSPRRRQEFDRKLGLWLNGDRRYKFPSIKVSALPPPSNG